MTADERRTVLRRPASLPAIGAAAAGAARRGLDAALARWTRRHAGDQRTARTREYA